MPVRVTVLLTVYNGLPYLKEAVESVLCQDLQDLELLIMDDASTDGSAELLESYSDPRIRRVRNARNIGQAASMNLGFSLARGRYIARLDQDDACLPSRLSSQVAFLEASPKMAVAGTWFYGIDARGRRTGLTPGVAGLSAGNFGAFLGTLLTWATPVGHPTAMFRREVVEDAGGYDASFAPAEDFELWCRLALKRLHLGVIPRSLMKVRLHGGQQSSTRLAAQMAGSRRAHERLVAAFSNGAPTRSLALLLRMEEEYWLERPSAREVEADCEALGMMLKTIRERLHLSGTECAHLAQRISWWLGRGAWLAILRKRRSQSLPVWRFALRQNMGALRFPSLLAYPACFALSPLLPPASDRLLNSAAQRMRDLRSQYRLMLDAVRGLAA